MILEAKYLKEQREDYNKLINFLNEYYKIEIKNEVKNDLKLIHKVSWIIIIWLRELKRNKIESKFLNEILTNLISMIHVYIHNDIKLCNFILRNSIENFIRFYNIYLSQIDTASSPDKIFEIIFNKFNDNMCFINNNFQILRSVYKECCDYIHSNNLDDENFCKNLDQYDNFYDDKEITRFNNNFDNVHRAMNNLILLNSKMIYEQMYLNNKSIIDDFVNKDDMKKIIEVWRYKS
ncbi:hypothetical protein ABG79_02443 [Caloramator mitchellensis]|uniref:Uncharacterized protein n=1 Tax=Caloramator mitchellensis TaxID=908809 RepID=A0A0R3JY03_CALMK|nr:hypothetical protein [Caloramator mitchellensis]KRQ85788.1 hypothetical protein ABG79_02443 [Caloramator mitchellensis]